MQVSLPIFDEDVEPSVLADFDTGRVLDLLSLGIIVLDAHMFVTYANAKAEEMLALHVQGIRGRPLVDLLPQAAQLLGAVRHVLDTRETLNCNLRAVAAAFPSGIRLGVRIAALPPHLTGTHLLLEMSMQDDPN
jgi:nitrogen-specific signal transduction histidine kinase